MSVSRMRIVENFYVCVFADEEWFSSVFSSVNSINGHINSQAAMWAHSFEETGMVGDANPPLKRRINLMNLSDDGIEALSDVELGDALSARGVDLALFPDKQAMVRKAHSL